MKIALIPDKQEVASLEDSRAKTAMIVDDDATSRKLLKSILLANGFDEIEEQENGEAAWDRLTDHPMALVLADWHMGDMSGLELAKRIRGDARFERTKVIMVTSEDRHAHIVEAIKAGVHGYIMKPFSKHKVQEKIQELFPSSDPSTASPSGNTRPTTEPSQDSTTSRDRAPDPGDMTDPAGDPPRPS